MAHLYLPLMAPTLATMMDTDIFDAAWNREELIQAPPAYMVSAEVPLFVLPMMPGGTAAPLPVTVRLVLLLTPENAAAMVVVPGPTLVAKPLALIVATPGLEEVHAAWLVRFWVLESEYVPVAVYCCVKPLEMLAFAGVTA